MHNIRRSIRLLSVESIITSGVFAMPIFTSFFQYEIGMTMTQIALSQSLFTVALLVLNVPAGWIADRFSRKWCNIAGDLICVGGFFGYSQATTFFDIVVFEIVLGIGLAFSGGADFALFKAYSAIAGLSYEKLIARITSWRFVMEIAAVLIGGYIGATNPRLAIGLSAAQSAIGAVLSLFIVEAGERRVTESHPLRDMVNITRYALSENRPLALRIAAFVIGREATHHLVWLLTPLALLAGVPAWLVGTAWAFNLASAWLGSNVAHRYSLHMSDAMIIFVGCITYVLAGLALSVSVSLMTIGLYAGFGFARGWYAATLIPMVQRHTPADIQTTVLSVAGSAAQIVYIPAGWLLGYLADISLQTSVLGSMIIFLPAFVWVILAIQRLERR